MAARSGWITIAQPNVALAAPILYDPARMPFRVGDRVDRYELLAQLGEGGQGTVWRVRDLLPPNEERALKIVPVRGVSPAALERSRREAQLLGELRHPALVRCHGLFESYEHGVIGLVLDLADGANLLGRLGDARFDRWHRQEALRQIAEALAYLHARGLVHRDVKLENVVVTNDFWRDPTALGAVRLVDFGISAAIGNPRGLTDVGSFIGTLQYMAPELLDPSRWRAPPATPAIDVFAFGVLGGILLRGGHPTDLPPGSTGSEYARRYEAIEQGAAPWSATAGADRWDEVLRQGVAPSAARRWPDAAAILAALGGEIEAIGAPPTADYRPPEQTEVPSNHRTAPAAPPPAEAFRPSVSSMPGTSTPTASNPAIARPHSVARARGAGASPVLVATAALALLLVGGAALIGVVSLFTGDSGSPPDARSTDRPPSRSSYVPPSTPTKEVASQTAPGSVACPARDNANPCQSLYSEVPKSLSTPVAEATYQLRLSWISMKGKAPAPDWICFRRDGGKEQCASTPANDEGKCGRDRRIPISPADLTSGRISFRTLTDRGAETASGRFKALATRPLNKMLCIGAKLDLESLVPSSPDPVPPIDSVYFFLDPR